MAEARTSPCEQCGIPVTKTATQQHHRKYWTCSQSCANKRRIQLGNTPAWAPNPLRGQQDTRPCAVCSKPVTRYLSQSRAKIHAWACSRSCAAALRGRAKVADGTWNRPVKPRRGDTVPCLVCGKPFYRQQSYIAQGRKLCSRECNRLYQTKPPVLKSCARCGAALVLKPSQAARAYCSTACNATAKTKRASGRTHNGRPVIINAQGYFTVYEPTHPAANKHNGRVLEHRLIMEKVIGRYLLTDEHIDHIDQDKTNNDPSNLQVLSPTNHAKKTSTDQQRARAKLLAELAAYREKYGELPME